MSTLRKYTMGHERQLWYGEKLRLMSELATRSERNGLIICNENQMQQQGKMYGDARVSTNEQHIDR